MWVENPPARLKSALVLVDEPAPIRSLRSSADSRSPILTGVARQAVVEGRVRQARARTEGLESARQLVGAENQSDQLRRPSGIRGWGLRVPRLHPTRPGDDPVLVDEAAQMVGVSVLGSIFAIGAGSESSRDAARWPREPWGRWAL